MDAFCAFVADFSWPTTYDFGASQCVACRRTLQHTHMRAFRIPVRVVSTITGYLRSAIPASQVGSTYNVNLLNVILRFATIQAPPIASIPKSPYAGHFERRCRCVGPCTKHYPRARGATRNRVDALEHVLCRRFSAKEDARARSEHDNAWAARYVHTRRLICRRMLQDDSGVAAQAL